MRLTDYSVESAPARRLFGGARSSAGQANAQSVEARRSQVDHTGDLARGDIARARITRE